MSPRRETTFDVRIWAIRLAKGKSKRYEVRWQVAGKGRSKTFATAALANGFHADLLSSHNRGEAFDVELGLPVSKAPVREVITWWEWALIYVDLKCECASLRWPRLELFRRSDLAPLSTI